MKFATESQLSGKIKKVAFLETFSLRKIFIMATVSLPPQLLTRLMTSERSLTSWPIVLKSLT